MLPNIIFLYKINRQKHSKYDIILVINKYKQFFMRAIKNTSVRHGNINTSYRVSITLF